MFPLRFETVSDDGSRRTYDVCKMEKRIEKTTRRIIVMVRPALQWNDNKRIQTYSY